jgi:hypothetical protein
MRWATRSLGALAVATVLLSATLPIVAGAAAPASTVPAAPSATGSATSASTVGGAGSLLTLRAQTSWVTPTAPWFTLSLGVGSNAGPAANLHVELTYYSRINDDTHMAQAINANGTPDEGVLNHFDAPVTATASGLGVVSCAVILPDTEAQAPVPTPGTLGVCPPNAHTVTLHCQPATGSCGDVYPVTVALYQQGNNSPLARFTTFLTYQEPQYSASVSKTGGALRVGVVLPVSSRPSSTLAGPTAADRRDAESLIGQIWAYRGIPLTLAANPLTVSDLAATTKGGKGPLAVKELQALETPADGDQLVSEPYVPIDPASLAGVNLTSEIGAQMVRGDDLLRLSNLHPTGGTWDATSSPVSTNNAANLATGLAATRSTRLIVTDSDLTSAGLNNLTFAQPFTLPLGHAGHVTGAGADSEIDALFTAYPRNPLLAANLLLANLEFVHFENAALTDPRGVVIEPPQFWQPPKGFLTVLLYGLTHNPALTPVNLDQFFLQVHKGGNGEPATRHLKSGSTSAASGMTPGLGRRLQTSRNDLTSLSGAAVDHPPVFATLSDLLLRTESQTFDPDQRVAALGVFTHRLDSVLGYVTLAIQGTITFTSRTAPIPVSVLSSAPFHIKVVLSLDSNKFTFPDGNTRKLTLDRPTTPVRIEARSRTSGDRLPVAVTLTTPDGQLVLARSALTVHSTSISLVGVGLTALAALVLLVWWGRTWRRGRRRGPRAA